MKTQLRTAQERRQQIQENAERLGIDYAYVSILVDTFYDRIRADERINYIFSNHIGDGWAPHLSNMKDFWASVAFNAGRYSGQPVPKHQALNEARPEHFEVWLELFEQTLKDTAPTPDAIPYFMERASRIASSLQLAMFGMSDLSSSKP